MKLLILYRHLRNINAYYLISSKCIPINIATNKQSLVHKTLSNCIPQYPTISDITLPFKSKKISHIHISAHIPISHYNVAPLSYKLVYKPQ